jgi:hypothetical protein
MQDNPDPNLFATEVRNCAGTTISLGVFSAKVRIHVLLHFGSIPFFASTFFTFFSCVSLCTVYSSHTSQVGTISSSTVPLTIL